MRHIPRLRAQTRTSPQTPHISLSRGRHISWSPNTPPSLLDDYPSDEYTLKVIMSISPVKAPPAMTKGMSVFPLQERPQEVHTCQLCPKSFKRAEHRNRHQQSRANAFPFPEFIMFKLIDTRFPRKTILMSYLLSAIRSQVSSCQ